MKSALDDPLRKVAGEAGVGLRERPKAAAQVCVLCPVAQACDLGLISSATNF